MSIMCEPATTAMGVAAVYGHFTAPRGQSLSCSELLKWLSRWDSHTVSYSRDVLYYLPQLTTLYTHCAHGCGNRGHELVGCLLSCALCTYNVCDSEPELGVSYLQYPLHGCSVEAASWNRNYWFHLLISQKIRCVQRIILIWMDMNMCNVADRAIQWRRIMDMNMYNEADRAIQWRRIFF